VSDMMKEFEMEKAAFTDSRQDKIKVTVGMFGMNRTQINVKRGVMTFDGWALPLQLRYIHCSSSLLVICIQITSGHVLLSFG
jgi:hypothetical protein